MRGGQAGAPPGVRFDDVCGFCADYFRIDFVGRTTLPRGIRWTAERRIDAPVPA